MILTKWLLIDSQKMLKKDEHQKFLDLSCSSREQIIYLIVSPFPTQNTYKD